MSNFWSQDNSNEESFRDIPEVSENDFVPPTVQNQSYKSRSESAVQEIIQEVVEEEEEDYESILADANLRIEQGTLYKMIMNSDMFSQMDVDQRAIDNVQREIRKFAKERMEIMLGMRQEATKETIVSSPFNDLEVTILKRVASAASKGATEARDSVKTASPSVPELPKKSNTLNPIGPQKTSPVKKIASVIQKTNPIVRKPKAANSIEEAVAADSNYKPLDKPLEKMTEEELLQRNKDSAVRQAVFKAVKSTTSLPVPSVDQMNAINSMRAAEVVNVPGLSNLVNMAKARA